MSVSVLIIGPGRCDMTGSLIARDRRQLPKDTLLSRQRRRCACNADPLQRLRSHVLLISNRGTHRVLRYTLGTGVHIGYWGTHRVLGYTSDNEVHTGYWGTQRGAGGRPIGNAQSGTLTGEAEGGGDKRNKILEMSRERAREQRVLLLLSSTLCVG